MMVAIKSCVLVLLVTACTRNAEPSTSPIVQHASRSIPGDIVERADELLAASIADDFGPPRVMHPSQRMRDRAIELLGIACFERNRLDGCTRLMNYTSRWKRFVVALHAERFCVEDSASGFCKLTMPPMEDTFLGVCEPTTPLEEWSTACRGGFIHSCGCIVRVYGATPARHQAVQKLRQDCEAGSSVACDIHKSLDLTKAEVKAAAHAIAFNQCFVQHEDTACAYYPDVLVRAGRLVEARRFGEYGCRYDTMSCWTLAISYSHYGLPLPNPDRVEQLAEHVCRYDGDSETRDFACAHVPGSKLNW